MLRLLTLALALLFTDMAAGATEPDRYHAGQVWEYTTRPQDAGSLIRIQAIETGRLGPIYHISMSGISVRPPMLGEAAHLPVSRETLDKSVIHLVSESTRFPELDFNAGILEWRRARGGVFTIPLREIAELLDGMSQR